MPEVIANWYIPDFVIMLAIKFKVLTQKSEILNQCDKKRYIAQNPDTADFRKFGHMKPFLGLS